MSVLKKCLLFIICISFLQTIKSCDISEDLPEIPKIEFLEYRKITNSDGTDSAIVLVIKYQHGKGNLGLDQKDTLPPFHLDDDNPYQYNIFCEYLEEIEGEFRHVTVGVDEFSQDTVHMHGRFPNVEPSGSNKAIRGEIEYTVPVNPIESNRIMYRIWIVDRDIQKSNKVESPAIDLNL